MQKYSVSFSNEVRERMREDSEFASSMAFVNAQRLTENLIEAAFMHTPITIDEQIRACAERSELIGGLAWKLFHYNSTPHQELSRNIRRAYQLLAWIKIFHGEYIHVDISMCEKSNKRWFVQMSFEIEIKTGQLSGGSCVYRTVPPIV